MKNKTDSQKNLSVLQALENWLEFLRNLKTDAILCVDFNIDKIKDWKVKFDWEDFFLEFDFKQRNFKPTRVTPTSATCLDHILTSYQANTETIKAPIGGHCTNSGLIHGVIINESPCCEMKWRCRDLRSIKIGNALHFCFNWIKHSKNLNLYKNFTLEKYQKLSRFFSTKSCKRKKNSEKAINWLR